MQAQPDTAFGQRFLDTADSAPLSVRAVVTSGYQTYARTPKG